MIDFILANLNSLLAFFIEIFIGIIIGIIIGILIFLQKQMKSHIIEEPIIKEPVIKKLENNIKYITYDEFDKLNLTNAVIKGLKIQDDKGKDIIFESLDVNNICKTLNIYNGKNKSNIDNFKEIKKLLKNNNYKINIHIKLGNEHGRRKKDKGCGDDIYYKN